MFVRNNLYDKCKITLIINKMCDLTKVLWTLNTTFQLCNKLVILWRYYLGCTLTLPHWNKSVIQLACG